MTFSRNCAYDYELNIYIIEEFALQNNGFAFPQCTKQDKIKSLSENLETALNCDVKQSG
jgi:hypothetical protein